MILYIRLYFGNYILLFLILYLIQAHFNPFTIGRLNAFRNDFNTYINMLTLESVFKKFFYLLLSSFFYICYIIL